MQPPNEQSDHWPEPWPLIDDSLITAVTALDQAAINTSADGDIDDVARRLDYALRIIAIAKAVQAECEQRLIDHLGDGEPLALAGIGIITRERVARSSWKPGQADRFRTDIIHAVARDVALDISTNEIDPVKRNIARAALTELVDVLPAIQSLKQGGAKRLGLAMGDYREYSDGYKIVVNTAGAE